MFTTISHPFGSSKQWSAQSSRGFVRVVSLPVHRGMESVDNSSVEEGGVK